MASSASSRTAAAPCTRRARAASLRRHDLPLAVLGSDLCEAHRFLRAAVPCCRDCVLAPSPALGNRPAAGPSSAFRAENAGKRKRERWTASHRRYESAYAAWRADPEAWWAEKAAGIDWDRRWDRVFDPASGPYGRWFPGAMLNTCHNCLDRHVAAGRGEQAALIWDSPLAGETARASPMREMRDRTARLAGALAAPGVGRGDRVVIYMPMVPEAVLAMLACARLGAVHSVVFGGFAAPELAARIADARPKLVISASCGIEPGRVVAYKPLLDQAIALSPAPARDLPDPAAPHAERGARRRARPRLRRGDGGRSAARSGAGGGDRSALHPLHLGHDGQAQGHRARQWRPRRRAAQLHAHDLRRRRRRGDVHRLRHRLGGRATATSSTRRCSPAAPR